MRFHRRTSSPTLSERRRSWLHAGQRLVPALALLFAACRGEVLTDPASGGLRPTAPDLTLTGGAGTQIFPTVSPGDAQPIGIAVGLNDAGQVTGSETLITVSGDFFPFRWSTATGAVPISGCCDTRSGNDINDAGTVVGTAQTNAFAGNHGFVATGTTMTTLPALPGSDVELSSGAIAINNSGQIVGVSPASGGAFASHAVLWSAAGAIQDLGTLGGTNSAAIDINDAGQVIGSSQTAGNSATHFFLWSSGSGMQDLNTLIDPNVTSVVEINTSGQIIGTYSPTNGGSHAFIYTPGSGLRDLGTLGGTTSAPTGLNDKGDVVGSSTLANGTTHAFLWTAAEGMEDITALTGIPEVRRLNDNLQTLTGTAAPSATAPVTGRLRPRLVQLQVTQSNAPPTAVFTVQCNGLTCSLDASGSLDDKPGLTYAWDLNKFPNGSATGAVATVTYPHASTRTITLTVTDAQGLTSTLSKTVTVTDYPVAAFTYSCTGLTCTFDPSGSTNNGAPIEEYLWTFGDGQAAASSNPSHTYAQPGTYAVTLEARDYTNNRRGSITQQVTVSAPAQNQPPVASFTFSCSNLTCSFDGTGSTDDKGIVSYVWDLNKFPGGSATGPTTTATYPHAGSRSVTLTVTDANGLSNSVTKTFDPGATTPPPPPPVDAAPVAKFTSSCNGTVCTMDASTSTDDVGITSYAWNLGKSPGGSATGVSVTTDYWHSGTRTVTLTVTDTKGQTNSVTQTVTVP
jgi:probable HAF family extracellular repeat protein